MEVAWPLSEVELPVELPEVELPEVELPVVALLLYVDPVLVLRLVLLLVVPLDCCGGQTWPGGQGTALTGGR